ncbi:hypothetical protein A464_plas0098 (plasmid) [Salmonella bongori N268-08]|uniref:Uncharacterized protein n=1 Tax=Salmonella bongori N268-08 TaxID=1197719 RepID=S5NNX0_SALBN|nr:hypothetical protein A464_plas0098 [Salmonella bongori N268-08]
MSQIQNHLVIVAIDGMTGRPYAAYPLFCQTGHLWDASRQKPQPAEKGITF